jgi:hypothetical protein
MIQFALILPTFNITINDPKKILKTQFLLKSQNFNYCIFVIENGFPLKKQPQSNFFGYEIPQRLAKALKEKRN